MTDHVNDETRTRIIRAVRRVGTGPELTLRRALSELGYRYRCNVVTLPGRPDFAFTKLRTVISVHGQIWHGHGCRKCPNELRLQHRAHVAVQKYGVQ